MALDDDLVDVVRLAGVEAPQSEVVDDEKIEGEQAAHGLLPRVIGLGLVEFSEHLVRAQEEDAATGPTGGVSETGGEQRLPDADRPEEKDIFGAFEEAETEEVPDPIPVEGDGSIPVEVLEGADFLEGGLLDADGEVVLLPTVDLVLQDQFQEVVGGEGRLARVGHAIGERGEDAGELQALEDGLERGLSLHRSGSPFRSGVCG